MWSSQSGVKQRVDVCAKGGEIDGGDTAPPGEKRIGGNRRTRRGAKFRDRLAGAGDRDLLSARHAIDDIAAVVAQLSDAYMTHAGSVSPVIQTGATANVPLMPEEKRSWIVDELAYAGRENRDPVHVARYDGKMDSEAAAELAELRAAGLSEDATVIDIGAGTGQFALAAAGAVRRVVAVDVSPVMLEHLRAKLRNGGFDNVECVEGGFLTYEHRGELADLVYSRLALHHLPDFWKARALVRVAEMLRPGGILRLSDVVYGFEPVEAEARLEQWMAEMASDSVEGGWTRAELEEHVRDEHSTFTWLLEPMIEKAGFEVEHADYSDDGIFARYRCVRTALD